jgi:hypothetical protein
MKKKKIIFTTKALLPPPPPPPLYHTAQKGLCYPAHIPIVETSARIYRPSFRENKLKTLAFSHRKRAFWACFGENWVFKLGHSSIVDNVSRVLIIMLHAGMNDYKYIQKLNKEICYTVQ